MPHPVSCDTLYELRTCGEHARLTFSNLSVIIFGAGPQLEHSPKHAVAPRVTLAALIPGRRRRPRVRQASVLEVPGKYSRPQFLELAWRWLRIPGTRTDSVTASRHAYTNAKSYLAQRRRQMRGTAEEVAAAAAVTPPSSAASTSRTQRALVVRGASHDAGCSLRSTRRGRRRRVRSSGPDTSGGDGGRPFAGGGPMAAALFCDALERRRRATARRSAGHRRAAERLMVEAREASRRSVRAGRRLAAS